MDSYSVCGGNYGLYPYYRTTNTVGTGGILALLNFASLRELFIPPFCDAKFSTLVYPGGVSTALYELAQVITWSSLCVHTPALFFHACYFPAQWLTHSTSDIILLLGCTKPIPKNNCWLTIHLMAIGVVTDETMGVRKQSPTDSTDCELQITNCWRSCPSSMKPRRNNAG